MSAPSPRAVLTKRRTFTQYCNSTRSPLESFSSFSHKLQSLFQAENFLGSVVPREASQFQREFMQFAVPSGSCAN